MLRGTTGLFLLFLYMLLASVLATNSTTDTNSTCVNGTTNGTNGTSCDQGSTTDDRFAPPEDITTDSLETTTNPSATNRIKNMNQVQYISVEATTVSGVASTKFTLSKFNRELPGNFDTQEVTLEGNWAASMTSKDGSTCILVKKDSVEEFRAIATTTASSVTTFRTLPTTATASLTSADLSTLQLSSGCSMMKKGSEILKLSTTEASFSPITLPFSPPTINSLSRSMMYGVFGDSVVKYTMSSNSYTTVRTFGTTYDHYSIWNSGNRVVVVGVIVSGTSRNQKFWAFLDEGAAQLTSVGSFSITAETNEADYFIKYLLSPRLTKLTVSYYETIGGELMSTFKSIDYDSKSMGDMQLNNALQYKETITYSGLDFVAVAFGQTYYVLRNQSGTSPWDAPPVEVAYQFMGNKVFYLRERSYVDSSTLYIDSFYTDRLVLIELVISDDFTSVSINAYEYGSMQTVNRLLPTYPASQVNLTIPSSFTYEYTSSDNFRWIYATHDSGSTTFDSFRFVRGASNNYQQRQSTISGQWEILSHNTLCRLIHSSGLSQLILRQHDSANSTTMSHDLSSFLPTLTITSSTKYSISQDCSRIRIGGDVLFYNSNTTPAQWAFIGGSAGSFSFDAIDSEVNVAIVGTKIYRFASDDFVEELTLVLPSVPSCSIWSYNNRVLISCTNSTSGILLALKKNADGTYVECLRHLATSFTQAPGFNVSPELTKALMIGGYIAPGTANVAPKVDCFNIVYSKGYSLKIDFPMESLGSPLDTYIQMGDHLLYVRQMYTAVPGGSTPSNQEHLYFLEQDLFPREIFTKEITQQNADTWVKTLPEATDSGLIYLLSEYKIGSSFYLVNQTQTSAQQGQVNSNPLAPAATFFENGVEKQCKPGCNDCSQGVCASCKDGFVLNEQSLTCVKCGKNCKTCTSSNRRSCETCYSGSYLSGTSCLKCDSICVTCETSSTNCLVPKPGTVIESGAVVQCPNNCISCSSSTVCTTCQEGFVPDSGECLGCSMFCSNCSVSNITECTSCADGLQLLQGTCQTCPDKCLECNDGVCADCVPGYSVSTIDSSLCVPACSIRCKTCTDNLPNFCTSCYGSITPNSDGQCILDTSCNSDSEGCSDCGSTLGYVLVAAQCIECQTITNCLQCSQENTGQCKICENGYYVDEDDGSCQPCDSSCRLCSSGDLCTGCPDGATLAFSQTQGQCLTCNSPCQTCQGSSDYCTSCIAGYDKISWKCQKQKYVGFTILFSENPDVILLRMSAIVTSLLNIIKKTNSGLFTFKTIIAGSTSTEAVMDTDSVSADASILQSGISSGATLGGSTVLSSSVTTVGVNTSSSSGDDSNNLGLIIGLSIGLGALVVLGVILGIVIYRKKKMEEERVDSDRGAHSKVDNFEEVQESKRENNLTNENLMPGMKSTDKRFELMNFHDQFENLDDGGKQYMKPVSLEEAEPVGSKS